VAEACSKQTSDAYQGVSNHIKITIGSFYSFGFHEPMFTCFLA